MFLYVLSLEPLIQKINENKKIEGIKLPNFIDEIKSLQHADDTTVIIKHENSYYYLNEEIKKFEKVSGSKINDNKLQILIVGENEHDFKVIPKDYIKDNIKIYGVIFGKDYIEQNLNKLVLEIGQIINKWNTINLNIIEKVIVIKTYIISKIQYIQQVIEIPNYYIDKFNSLIFRYLWSGRDKINRKTITNNIEKGGLGLTDIKTSILTTKVTRIKKNDRKQGSTMGVFIYLLVWF